MSFVVGTHSMRRAAHFWLATLAGLLAIAVAGTVTDVSFGPLESFVSRWSYNVVLLGASLSCLARGLLVSSGRRGWCLLGIGMGLWSMGNVYYSAALWDAAVIPVPSISDGFWMVFYPLSMVAVVSLLRGRMESSGLRLWLDGAMGALAAGSFVAAFLFAPLLDGASGHALALALNFSYPIGDLLLVSMVVGTIGLNGWRLDATLGWLGGGLMLFGLTDSLYLVQVAEETWVPGNFFEAGWPAAMLCLGFAAWRPHQGFAEVNPYGMRIAMMPLAFASLALSIVIFDHFQRVNIFSLLMASAALAIAIMRMTLMFKQNIEVLGASQQEALTDALTGLGNRRRLMGDLEDACAKASADEPLALLIFDLDGFKQYNDTFGHPAGDALLVRLAKALEQMTVGGCAYRLGGDEFCVLVSCRNASADAISTRLLPALSERGEGFTVCASAGWCVIPDEETTPSTALRRADRRMYEDKNEGRISEGRLAGNVLVQVLRESDPRLHAHHNGVAALAEDLCGSLGVAEVEAQLVCLAAELHDVGKVAVPDEVLNKPAPLDDDEMAFIRQHTIIGQRILGVSPALNYVAQLVRSSHEAVDGSGYPDALAGDAIPLGSRIVAVCDAFNAMTSERPYRGAMTVPEAVAELRRCAGTQFDQRVVEAFVALLTAGAGGNEMAYDRA